MNIELFIARRLISDKDSKKNVSYTIARIATVSIALSLSVMIIAVAVVTGFKKEIRKKVIGFGAHIEITNFDSNNSYETTPISQNQDFYETITSVNGVKHIQVYAKKAGIIKTETDIQGVLLKGVDKHYDWSFFKNNLVSGSIFELTDTAKTNKALISNNLASKLKFNVGDKFIVHFPQEEPAKFRKFTIEGIYETGLEEFDKLFVIVDIQHIQKLNQWNEDEISGFEILVDNFNQLDKMTNVVYNIAGNRFLEDGGQLKVVNVKNRYPQIFDWINLQNINVWILLGLTLGIAILNMITSLLILILERTNMIGILKSFGSLNETIRGIFLYQTGFLIFKGVLWGNIIGIAICWIQYQFEILKLDQASYWLSTVPINFNLGYILLINFGTLLIIILILMIPSVVISKIDPVKTIRFN